MGTDVSTGSASQPRVAAIWINEGFSQNSKADRSLAEGFAEGRGLVIGRDYRLERGAGDRLRRFWVDRLLEDAASGQIEAVVSPSLATLAADPGDLTRMLAELRSAKLRLLLAAEGVDTADPGGEILYAFAQSMARWAHHRSGAADVPKGFHVRQKGLAVRNTAPFGYQWVEGRLMINSREAPIRRMLFELYAVTPNRKTVAATLNSHGLRLRRGQRFTERHIRALLEDPVAKGLFRGNFKSAVDHTRHHSVRSQAFAHIQVESIVSAELWEDCNSKLKAEA